MLGAPGGQKQEDTPLGLQRPRGPALPGFQAAAPGWSTPSTLLYFCVTADAGPTPRAEGQLLAQNHQGAGWTGQGSPAFLPVLNMKPCGRTSSQMATRGAGLCLECSGTPGLCICTEDSHRRALTSRCSWGQKLRSQQDAVPTAPGLDGHCQPGA